MNLLSHFNFLISKEDPAHASRFDSYWNEKRKHKSGTNGECERYELFLSSSRNLTWWGWWEVLMIYTHVNSSSVAKREVLHITSDLYFQTGESIWIGSKSAAFGPMSMKKELTVALSRVQGEYTGKHSQHYPIFQQIGFFVSHDKRNLVIPRFGRANHPLPCTERNFIATQTERSFRTPPETRKIK